MSWCTIVVPTYNGQPFVGDLIGSLAGQLNSDCDLIFLDEKALTVPCHILFAAALVPGKLLPTNRMLDYTRLLISLRLWSIPNVYRSYFKMIG
jgi:hypothetical protein